MRFWLSVAVWMCVLVVAAHAAEWVYVYEDGCPVGYAVGTGFEFYSVTTEEIVQGNKELMAELSGYGPHRATVGAAPAKSGDDTAAGEHYTPRPDGVNVSGVSLRDYLSPGDWQAVYGDYYGPRSYYAELDKSGVHWNWDSTTYDTAGRIYGLDADDQGRPVYSRGTRERFMSDMVWRRGTMEGSVFNLRGLTYETNIRDAGEQPVDVKLRRLQGDLHVVEHGYSIDAAMFGGKYNSNRLAMDNAFYGGSLEANHWFGHNFGVFADGKMTSIDVGGTGATVTRGDYGGELALDYGGARLTGFMRSRQEDNSFVANSNTRGYDDLGLRFDYHAGAKGDFTASYRTRDVDLERLRIEDDGAEELLYALAPSRDDFAAFRETVSASGTKLDLQGRLELVERLNLHARYSAEDWDTLPGTGNLIDTEVQPSYFSDNRRNASAELVYNLACNGRLSLRTEQAERENALRSSKFSRLRHKLGYSAALCKKLRWGIDVSRSETELDLDSTAYDWSNNTWDYDVMFAGQAGLGDYRLNYRKHNAGNTLGGDYDSLGLELELDDVPLKFSAWWRDRSGAMDGFADFDDLGINIGYQISVR